MNTLRTNRVIRVATHSGSLSNLLQGQLRFMSSYFDMIGIGSEGDRIDGQTTIERLAQSENVRVVPVEMTRAITPIKDLQALYKLYKVFKREKPLIVHSHTPKAGTLAMIAARISKVPHRLHTVAGLPLVEAKGIKRQLLNVVEKLTYACATKVYPNSFGLRDIIIANSFTYLEKTKVIGQGSSNGIDTSYFDPDQYSNGTNEHLRTELSFRDSDFIFIFLGRVVRDKGINELIAAFKELGIRHSRAKLLLVGYYETSTAQLLPETEREIATNRQITVLGWQDDVRPFLAIADVLAFPSYREGFPNTVLQASAMKVPSIVCDINGCNEIIREGVNGTIIPVKNASALEKAMEKLMDDSAYYNRLVENSRESIRDNYERRDVWKSLLEEYNELSQQQNM